MRLLREPRPRLYAVPLLALLFASSASAQYQKVRVASFSTTSTSFVDVTGGSVTFTPSATTEIWILLLSARLKSTSTAEVAAEAQYTVNGTVHGMGGVQNSLANAGGSWQHFYRVTGTTAKQTVQAQIRDVTGSTATIENLQIVAFRLPANADFQYSENEALQSVPGSVWGNFQALSFTPTSPGDYLILALANGHESPGLASIGLRVEDPALSYWPESPSGLPTDYLSIGRAAWQSFFVARVQSLTASSQAYNLQAYGSTGGSEVRFTRLMAFRTDAFELVESVLDVPRTSTTSTTPVVKTTLTAAAPPAARDYVVIQSLIPDANASATDERRTGFNASGVSRASYAHVVDEGGYRASFGFFDAWTTDRSVTYENTYSTSNAAFTVRAKESAIHVLRFSSSSCPCNALSATEGGSTLTVTSASSFETIFDKAFGGSLNVFYDLAEDPGRAYNLVSRASNNFYGLFHASVISGGLLHATGTNSTGAKLDLLEFTPTRVRVREESFFQRVPPATGILTGLKGIADYSVYPSGKIGVRWNRKTTASVPYTDHPLEMSAHLEAALPLSDLTGYSESDGTFNNPGGDDFVLAQREASGVRTDILGITYRDWAEADQLELTNTVAFFSWRDLTPNTIPAGSDDVWDFLFYTKPTNFQHHLDPAVTGRRDDYRAPDGLSFAVGSGWNENTADGDFFNESEAAYTVNFAPGAGLTFDMNGSSATRRQPFLKIRQWRSLQDPSVSLESASLTNDVHFRADVKPISRAHFAQDLLWHSTLQNAAAVTAPDVGSAATVNGTTTFVTARYGSGALFDALNEYVTFTSAADMDVAKGAVDLWYRPNYAYADGIDHRLWTYREDATHHFRLIKTAANTLRFVAINGAVTSETIVLPANYSWRANDWVHFRVTWDSSAPLADQLRIFFNGTEPAHTDPVSAYSSVGMLGGGIHYIGAAFDGTTPASGIIDELRIYGGSPSTPADLAWGGLATNGYEYLAAGTRNFTFNFTAVDPNRRGEYLYLGSDSRYRGVNVALQTMGAGSPDLQWQFWNGTSWTNLETVAGFTDETSQLTRPGTIYWTADPAGWSPYSVNGGPDLYYVRSYLASGSYSTPPEEWMIKTDILVFQYCGDIDLAGETFAFGLPAPTAVELLSFEARGGDQSVELAWATASEVNNIGFHLYRAESEDGPYEPITAAPVPGLGSSPEGARYAYTDSGLRNGTTYFYKLEDIDTAGETKLHGPVSATPQPGETSSSNEGPPPPSRGSLTYGDPAGMSFRILHQDERQAVLELVTPGFYADAEDDGSVRISVPGFVELADTGAPSLPVKRAWVEAVAGRAIKLSSIRATDVVTFSGLRPAAAAPPELEATPRGTVRARAGRGRPQPAPSATGIYPREVSRLVTSGFQGESKKALVELAPLRWDSSSGQLSLARRLEVRLVFAGRDVGEEARDARRGRAHRESGNHALRSGLVARLAVREPGLHAVRFEEVFGRGRAVEPGRLRLSRLSSPVAFHTEPRGGVFGPGSRLFFVSEGEKANPYGVEAVYELELAGEGARMEVDTAPPSGEASAFYWKREEREENRYYQAGLLDREENWLWDALLAPAAKTYGFEVNGQATTNRDSRLEVWLQGASDEGSVLDHHVRVSVNGVLAGDASWDGMSAHRFEADLASGILREGTNVLAVENVGDAGARFSMVFLDRFEIHYPSQMGAESGRWEGSFSEAGWFEVNGIGDAYVLDVTASSPRWVVGGRPTATGMSFRTEAGHRYRIASELGLRRPEVRRPLTTRIKSTGNRADYLVIGPRSFLAEAGPLLELRRSEGLRVMAVPVEEIFAEFGFGESRPEAVRDFLSYAYHHWKEPAFRYVLLLGDGTYDYKNYLGLNGSNPVPPLLIKTSYLWTASDPRLAAINGEDELPDLAIGRLPASTRAEARLLVEKIVAYERGSRGGSPVVLIADNSDRAGNFASHAEELSREVIPDSEVKKIYLGELGVPTTREAILSAFDDGASLLSYLGHGGIHLWADENLLNIGQVSSLAAQPDQPLVLTMNCLNGYFHFPYFNSLAEELLKAEGKGAIAAFSPSGLSLDDPAHLYHKLLLEELFHGSHARLGDAVLAAQSAFAEAGAFPELLSIYHLFGDPALRIRLSR